MTFVQSSPPSLVIRGGSVASAVEAGVTAERSGFSSVWTSEVYHRSAIVTLTALAAATSRIAIGSGIAWAFGRTPLTLATDARSIDEVSGGRLSLGIGTGSPPVIADWHGVRAPHPAPQIEEFVHVLRQIWQLGEQPVAHDGRFYRCRLPADPSVRPLVRGTLPVLMAGVRPSMLRAAGAVADGLVGHPLFTRRYLDDVVRPALAAGADRARRDTRVPISGMIICAISDDSAKARADAASQIAAYATLTACDPIFEFHGFSREVAAIRSAFASKDFPAMTAAVTDRMVDEHAVFGTKEEVRDRYQERFASLYEQPLLYSPNIGLSPEYLRDNLHAICETFAYRRSSDDRPATYSRRGA